MTRVGTGRVGSPRQVLPELRALAGGTFLMGDACGRADERPVHAVTVGAFEIGVCPVTVGEYAVFLRATGHERPRDWGEPGFAAAELPVCGVSWFDAAAYAAWLSALTGRCYHLPTEAQREFASRGGVEQQAYPWGDEPPAQTGVYERAFKGEHVGQPFPVQSPLGKGPNGFGLWHMADNVHEWCADYYDPDYYAHSPAIDPRGPDAHGLPSAVPLRRAARGGSWRHDLKYCRNAARSSLAPDKRFTDFGFRLAASERFEYV